MSAPKMSWGRGCWFPPKTLRSDDSDIWLPTIVAVAHGDHGLVWRAPSVNGLEDSLVQGARPFYQRIGVLPHSREIRWSQKWYGENQATIAS